MGPAGRERGPVTHDGSVLRVSAAVAAVSAGVLLLGLIWVGRPAAPAELDGGDDVTWVGVVDGQSVDAYLIAARDGLDRLAPTAGDTWALVSLDRYVPAAGLSALFDGVAVAQVYARVPLAAAHTSVVRIPVYRLPADVVGGMRGAALQHDRERAELIQLARRVEGAGQERARQAYAAAAGTAASEAAALRSGCACVFAAVVHAGPGRLRAVAGRATVRVVDPAPEVHRLDRTEFRPLLPDQVGVAAPGRKMPIPVPLSASVPVSAPGPNDGSAVAPPAAAPILSSLGAEVRSTSPRHSGRVTVSAPSSEESSATSPAPKATAARAVPVPPAAP